MQDSIHDLTIRNLSHFDEADQDSEFQAIIHRHRNDFLRSLNVTKRLRFKISHRIKKSLVLEYFQLIHYNSKQNHTIYSNFHFSIDIKVQSWFRFVCNFLRTSS